MPLDNDGAIVTLHINRPGRSIMMILPLFVVAAGMTRLSAIAFPSVCK
jgi:hypothetical protein